MNAIPFPFLSKAGGALIASPNVAVREQILQRIGGRCYPVQQVHGGADALARLEKGDWQVLYLDRRLPDLDAEELRSIIGQKFPRVPVILLDPDGSSPADAGDLSVVHRTGADIERKQNRDPRSETPLPGMVGTSEAMQRVYRMVRLVASRTTTVLITGPTGTGKELVARGIHAMSPRSSRPMVVVNCAAIPETLLESELFGFARGAFTGAVQSQLGRIAAAHTGTLFLDEISEMPLGMQAKLLRFLEQKELQRLGTVEVTRVDVRVVAASNVDLEGRISRGEFRQDLFYRLSAFPIELPPLNARPGDIVPLAEHFLQSIANTTETASLRLSTESVRALEQHLWRGNVRELQHVMERASILAEDSEVIEPSHLCLPELQTEMRGN